MLFSITPSYIYMQNQMTDGNNYTDNHFFLQNSIIIYKMTELWLQP